jgi:ABC-type transporter Mla MlaB component
MVGYLMVPFAMAGAIRPGEHACSRLAHEEDRERLAIGYVQSALVRGHKVIYLADRTDVDAFAARLAGLHEQLAAALDGGRFSVRPAEDVYAPDGIFEYRVMLEAIAHERDLALQEGYPALCLTGEMSALHRLPGGDDLVAYERALGSDPDNSTLMVLCQYDHGQLGAGTLREIADVHAVDIAPELAAIGRDGYLAAARVGRGPSATLRLCGELDFGCADTLASVLGAHYHGSLRLDLEDLEFVDVAGMRALRGRTAQPLTIVGATESVRRLLSLLAWDTDPSIEVLAAT